MTNDFNTIADPDVRLRLTESIHLDCADSELVIDKKYIVYALAYWNDGGLRVYLHTDKGTDFPYPYPIEMFTIIDSKIPKNWLIDCVNNPCMKSMKWIGFPEWVNDDNFYEKLVEGDIETIKIYEGLRNKVELL